AGERRAAGRATGLDFQKAAVDGVAAGRAAEDVLLAAADLRALIDAAGADDFAAAGVDRGAACAASGRDIDGTAVNGVEYRAAREDIQRATSQDGVAGVGLAR